jgi:phosphohistidine phosphatase SixA
MTIYLVRHAKAGSRSAWDGPDDQRPLSKNGRLQTDAVTDALTDSAVTRIITSPYVRCCQTVEPLAARLAIPMDMSDALAEGAPVADAIELLEKYADEDTVFCSHGDVIGDLLEHCEAQGVVLDGNRLEKASTWVIDFAAGRITSARYIPAPM